MENKSSISRVILWIARVWGGIGLLFLVFMVGAHLIEALTGTGDGTGFKSTSEFVSFLLFPVSTMIGLGLAFKWEGLGGLITVVGMIGFHIIRPDLLFDPMIDGLAFPGILFTLYWLLTKKGINPQADKN